MAMKEVMALLEKIIEEHKQIIGNFETSDRVANDASVMLELNRV
jgi:hypothetical protein